MPLPILQIAKLLARLAVLAPVAGKTVDTIRTLLETAHGDANTTKQIDALKEAAELQISVSEEMADQLRVIRSVLENVQKSLKIWAFATVGTAIAALAALIVALLK
jgi:hypothetical protein